MYDKKLYPKTEVIDFAFKETKNKHGIEQACEAIFYSMMKYDHKYITNERGAREKLERLSYYDHFHILADYAITKYKSLEMEASYSIKDVMKAENDYEGKNNYTKQSSLELFVTSLMYNTEFASMLLSHNPKLKSSLVSLFISDRYIEKELAFINVIDEETISAKLEDAYGNLILFTTGREMIAKNIKALENYNSFEYKNNISKTY